MTRPWVKFLLIASLALNLLIVGAVAGMAWRGPFGGGGGWQGGGAFGANVFGFLSQLPKERREFLQRRAGEIRPQIRDLREAVRAATRERMAALGADIFDRQRYINAQTRQIEAETRLRVLMRDAVADVAAEMTPQERRAFLKWRGQRRIHGGEGYEDLPQKTK